jgi:hypothetical protein
MGGTPYVSSVVYLKTELLTSNSHLATVNNPPDIISASARDGDVKGANLYGTEKTTTL